MKAKDFLEKAEAVLRERGAQYESGESENSMEEIVDLHASLTDSGASLTVEEGWLFMIALKLVRLRKGVEAGTAKPDSIVDLLGYIAKVGEHYSDEGVLSDEEPRDSMGHKCEAWYINQDSLGDYFCCVEPTCKRTRRNLMDFIGEENE